MICLKLLDKKSVTLMVSRGESEVQLVVTREYQEGDQIILEISDKNKFYWLQIDDGLGKSLVYLTSDLHYEIPFGEKRINLSPKAFYGSKHLVTVKEAREFEINMYRNLALNVNDQHGDTGCYPHASANVETRNESVFAAKNAIDGVTVNTSHGEWPYQSWGINRRDDAVLRIEFGRMVEVDRVVLYTRADFPHDNWWRKGTLIFSDESFVTFEMEKSSKPFEITFEPKQIEWVELGDLIKSDDPSPFPALTQIEIYGK